jgi:hypothetical protein
MRDGGVVESERSNPCAAATFAKCHKLVIIDAFSDSGSAGAPISVALQVRGKFTCARNTI